jgi:transposase
MLLKASLLMSLFSVRSERAFCEALDYDPRFRRFLDMDRVEPSFDHSTFTRNRDRLLNAQVASSSTRWFCRPIGWTC